MSENQLSKHSHICRVTLSQNKYDCPFLWIELHCLKATRNVSNKSQFSRYSLLNQSHAIWMSGDGTFCYQRRGGFGSGGKFLWGRGVGVTRKVEETRKNNPHTKIHVIFNLVFLPLVNHFIQTLSPFWCVLLARTSIMQMIPYKKS